jgi:tRNA uridine 5-carboxymethylaminomethyl modification enzyme
LREDNADARLTPIASQLGLIDDDSWHEFDAKQNHVSRETQRLGATWVSPKNTTQSELMRVLGKPLEHEHSLLDLLRRPGVDYLTLMGMDMGKHASVEISELLESSAAEVSHSETSTMQHVSRETSAAIVEQIDVMAKYSGYIDRQHAEIARAAHFEHFQLPNNMDYHQVTALGIEARQILSQHQPQTLGLASRISGITPSAVSLLLVHLKKQGYKGKIKSQV